MFGKTLADLQFTQAALADMATEMDAARLLTYRAAWLHDRGRPHAKEVAMAKMTATESAQRVIDQAVQMFGGRGAAFDSSGSPTRAALAFAQSCGTTVEGLERLEERKGTFVFFVGTKAGSDAVTLLPAIVQGALDQLPIPKRMRWGAGSAEFVRPVHWLVMLYGKEVIPATLLDTSAGQFTRGHRFLAPRPLRIASPASYASTLKKRGFVIADFAERRAKIRELAGAKAAEIGGRALIDPGLLDEVTALVEWPVAVAGRIDERFLALPREVLISTLEDHQRYFPLEDARGALLPWFITLSNIESRDPRKVREGNERVVRSRLADAAFFWEQDRKQPLARASRGPRARHLPGEARLARREDTPRANARARDCRGTGLRTRRRRACGGAVQVRPPDGDGRGVSGAAGHHGPVLRASRRRARGGRRGDPRALPAAQRRRCAAGDPRRHGARARRQARHARRDLRNRAETERHPRSLRAASRGDRRAAPPHRAAARPRSARLHRARGRAAARDGTSARSSRLRLHHRATARLLPRGRRACEPGGAVSTEMFDAVQATQPRSPLDFDARIQALAAFLQLPEAASLAAANKRIANILRKAEGGPRAGVDVALLQAPAEVRLFDAMRALENAVANTTAQREYAAALGHLAQLRGAVDTFFDEVMVNDPDERLRVNRLALLAQLRACSPGSPTCHACRAKRPCSSRLGRFHAIPFSMDIVATPSFSSPAGFAALPAALQASRASGGNLLFGR